MGTTVGEKKEKKKKKRQNKNSSTVSDTRARILSIMTESVLWTVFWIVLICTAKSLTVIVIVFSHSNQKQQS